MAMRYYVEPPIGCEGEKLKHEGEQEMRDLLFDKRKQRKNHLKEVRARHPRPVPRYECTNCLLWHDRGERLGTQCPECDLEMTFYS